MSLPNFIGLSHICVIVDNDMNAFDYYKRILGAVPDQCIPYYRNKGFFKAAGFVRDAERPDARLINDGPDYKVFRISHTEPTDFYCFDTNREADAADILGQIQYFYFIDRYGLQWEFEQGHTDIGS